MDLLKISLLLFSAFSHVYPTSTTNKTPAPWQHNTRKMNSLPDEHKNCFCYPDGQLPTVQQLLDSQNNAQERVVIYLYKNGATNEIKMYTPNANKQALIPDIPYDSGDGLVTVTTENVYTLLYNNPYKIKVYNDHIQTMVPTVTESFAIGLNTGAIENIYPNGNEYSLAPNVIIANGPSGAVVHKPEKGSITIPDNAFPERYDLNKVTPEQYWIANTYPYSKPDDPLAIPLNIHVTPDNPQVTPLNPQTTPDDAQALPLNPQTGTDNPQSPPYKLEATPLNYQPVLPNPQAYPENPQVYPGNSQAIPGNLPVYTGNSQEIPGNLQVYPGNSQEIPGNHPVYPGNSQEIPGNLQVYPGNSQAIPGNLQVVPVTPQAFPDSYVGGLDQHVVYTFQTGQGSNKPQSGSQDVNNPVAAQYVTFNVWFNQQMKRFQNIHLPNDIKTVDSNVLRVLVQKTLYENNIYVSVDGVITDSNGKVIDAANLELRPLLLGETFNHQILQNVRKIIKLPKHLPYLEGILVTLVSPPQILGIIPLGKTYLPETSYIAPSSLGALTNGSKIYINGIGNPNAASYSTLAKGPLSLAYKQIYEGPTNYYAFSGPNGVKPISANSNSEIYRKTLAYPYSSGNQRPQLGPNERMYWSSGPYQTVSQLPYTTANWNPSELLQLLGQRRMLDAKIEHHYEPPIKTRQKGRGRKKLNDGKGDVSKEVSKTVEPLPSINGTESGRRFPAPSLNGVMKTLLFLLNDLPGQRGLNSTEEVDIVKDSESESNKDGGGPDFRIIGGNAATGSGTPLSNKGRSGYTEYI